MLKGLAIGILILLAFGGVSWLDLGAREGFEGQEAPVQVPEVRKPPGGPVPDTRSLYEKARSLYRKGRLEEARRLYQNLLDLDPGHVEALNNLGVIHLQEGDLDSARGLLEKAIRLRPNFVEAFYNMACLYAARGETEESLSYLERAVALDPAAREWARADRDLEDLRGLKGFQEIVGERRPHQGRAG